VRESYALLARKHGVERRRRRYDPADWEAADPAQSLSLSRHCLLARFDRGSGAGRRLFARHRDSAHRQAALFCLRHCRSVEVDDGGTASLSSCRAGAAKGRLDMPAERAIRHACRDAFRKTRLLERIIPQIEEVLAAGALPRPEPPPEAAGPAFPDPETGP